MRRVLLIGALAVLVTPANAATQVCSGRAMVGKGVTIVQPADGKSECWITNAQANAGGCGTDGGQCTARGTVSDQYTTRQGKTVYRLGIDAVATSP